MPRPSHSLFIGRIHRNTRERDLEDVFERYGRLSRCEIKKGAELSYAFVDFDERRDAEDAIKYENGRDLCGSSIVVEWAKGTPRRSDYDGDRRRGYGGGYEDRDRGQQRRSYRSPPRHAHHSRSRSRDRNRRRSHTPQKGEDKQQRPASRSPSRSRSKSRSRSASPP